MFRSLLVSVFASAALTAPALSDNAEIINLFGVADQAWGAEVSPDGGNVAMGCAPLGPPAVCIYSLTDGAKPKLFQVPAKAKLNTFYWVSPKHMIIEADIYDRVETQRGFRDYTFTRAISYNLDTGKSEVLLTKDANYLFDATDVVAVLPDQDNKILMMLPFMNIETYEVNLDNGKAKRKKKYKDEIWTPVLDRNGDEIANVFFKYTVDETFQVTGSQVHKGSKISDFQVKLPDGKLIYEEKGVADPPLWVLGLAPNGKDLLVRGTENSFYGNRILSVETGELSEVEIGDKDYSYANPIEDIYTNKVIGFGYIDDIYQQDFIDTDFRTIHETLKPAFPDKTVTITSWTKDRSMMTLAVASPGQPVDYYLYEDATGNVSPLGNAAPQLQGKPLGEVLTIRYKAKDGLDIPGYLTLPAGKREEDGPFPMILMPHGGPEARDTADFDWWAQAYAAAGYAVLQPNFRGSTGYGEGFRNKGHGEFGGKMVTDVLDGYDWAVAQGYAKPGGYCIAGASYGGYSALQGAALSGEKAKCAIAVAAVGDPITFLRDLPEESQRYIYWTNYLGFGRFATDEEKARYVPTKNAGAVRAPLLVIHGREDSTVPFRQAQIINNAFEGRANYRFVEMAGEDHYLQSAEARQTVLQESLSFLEQFFPAE